MADPDTTPDLLYAGVQKTAISAAEDIDALPDAPPNEICVECLAASFWKGITKTFWQSFAAGVVVGAIGASLIIAGVVSAPVLLTVGAIVGVVGLVVQVAPLVTNWNKLTPNERAEVGGEIFGSVSGGAAGGFVGGAGAGVVSGGINSGFGGPMLQTAGGPSLGGTIAAEGTAVAASPTVAVGAAAGSIASSTTGPSNPPEGTGSDDKVNQALEQAANQSQSKSREQIADDLKSSGLKESGSPDRRFLHFKDSNGNTRARIDPPDSNTPTDHLHTYDSKGNSLDRNMNPVAHDSSSAHHPIGTGK